MDYKVFYRKYRPKNFNELIGQDSIREILVNSIKQKKLAHAYIFTGLRGTGKTSTAKIFAKTLNCLNNENGISCEKCDMCKTYNESADIIEIDAASNNGVEEIRNLRDSVKIAPYNSKYKIYIIDEVHMLSNSAWNAFLKTLEEPPNHVIFILATTELNKIPDTVKSRCQTFLFNKISSELMQKYLQKICKLEDIKIDIQAIDEIVKLARGSLRDALSYLDKISKIDKKITVELIEDNFGILNDKKLNELYKNIKEGNIDLINKNVENISKTGITPNNFINDFVNYLLNLIINKEVVDIKDIELIKSIINKLNNLISNFNSVLNPFLLIKIELMTLNYFPGNNSTISQEEKTKKYKEKTEEKQEEFVNNENNDDEIKLIRINNAFFEASKKLKEEFSNNWKQTIEKLVLDDNLNILGYVENAKIEVASKTNVLFSIKNESEAVIFNNNVSDIEKKYNDANKTNYKFIALSTKEWGEEKKKYIENKNKKYEYMDEEKLIKKNISNAENLANDIFGDKIIEIR